MLSQKKIDKFYSDVNSLDIKKKVSVITRETEFPQSNVSEWLRKVKMPSEAFIDTFYKKFNHLINKSTNYLQNSIVNEPESTYEIKSRSSVIEIKTASGKTLKVIPEGQSEIALLNAFLEERDRVIDTLNEEKQARIDELNKHKDDLLQIINSTLNQIHDDSRAALAYQKAWVKYEAEKVAKGNKQTEAQLRYKMSKLVDDELQGGESFDNPQEIGKQHKAQ